MNVDPDMKIVYLSLKESNFQITLINMIAFILIILSML